MAAPTLTNILMVEDEPDIQMLAKLALESLGGLTVETCNSGQEAIQTAPALAPDLILLDVMMPGMDGTETFKALREIPQLADTPVIFMTARVQPDEVAEYKELGALAVISKPFVPRKLSDTIQSIWRGHYGE